MSSNKRGLIMRNLLTSNGACGCGKPKPLEVHQPTPKPKISLYHNPTTTTKNNHTTTSLTSSSTTSGGDRNYDDEDLFTASTTVSETDTHLHQEQNNNKGTATKKNVSFLLKPNPKIVDSVAVEKESKDPYRDFRYSMLQMIFEKEIFSESGLQELLQCFLELNAPCHHHIIIQVFMQICEETFPKKFCCGDDDSGGQTSCRNN